MNTKTYLELSEFRTYDERLSYLQLHGAIGQATFGENRYFNQRLYRSSEWKRVRNLVILRDGGCDLGIQGLDILDRGVIHHINPITIEDIDYGSNRLFDLDNLILCSEETHRMIHYGYVRSKQFEYVERRPNDTCPWRCN